MIWTSTPTNDRLVDIWGLVGGRAGAGGWEGMRTHFLLLTGTLQSPTPLVGEVGLTVVLAKSRNARGCRRSVTRPFYSVA